MNGPGHRAGSLVGGMGAVLALGLLSPQVARAQSADVVVRVERTPNVRTLTTSPNWVPITITVVDRATQAPPTSDYNVVAYATGNAGEQTDAFGCGQRSDNNPGVPKGIYDCIVIVDHGGSWVFHGAVNSVPRGKEPTVTLAQGSVFVGSATRRERLVAICANGPNASAGARRNRGKRKAWRTWDNRPTLAVKALDQRLLIGLEAAVTDRPSSAGTGGHARE